MYKNKLNLISDVKKTGVILVNLGTPQSPTSSALRFYLTEFLTDNRVVELTKIKNFVWNYLLRLILFVYAPKSAKNYVKVWNSYGAGSPLLSISKAQLTKFKTYFYTNTNVEFALGMRYGKPLITTALQDLQVKNCEKIIILPLYPQYSSVTTGSTFDSISNEIGTWRNIPELIFINNYHKNQAYITALANSVHKHQQKNSIPDKLIVSFHGIPQRYVDNGDIYYKHCLTTSKLLAQALNLKNNEYQTTFQSIFGRQPWLKPYTKTVLKDIVGQGIKHVQVICPGFATDCLETLHEIKIENKHNFINAGGENFSYISALNDTDEHINMLCGIVNKYL